MGNGNEETEKRRHNLGSRTDREEEIWWTLAHTGGIFIVDCGHKESWS